jgi:mannose-6-phosphate isomerase-like protein (cupin superfamily)
LLEVGKRYTSPQTGTWVEVVERAGGNMKFERSYAPGTGRTDPHLHEDLTQTWEALSGEGMIEVDGEERELRAGAPVTISPGTIQRDPWNPSSNELLHVRGLFEPVNDFIEAYAEACPPSHRERPAQRSGRAAAAPGQRHRKGDERALLGALAVDRDPEGGAAADCRDRPAARLQAELRLSRGTHLR